MAKNQVIEVLANNDTPAQKFNALLILYRDHPKKIDWLFKKFNRTGFSKDNLEKIIYETKKIYEVSDTEVAVQSSAKVIKIKKNTVKADKVKKEKDSTEEDESNDVQEDEQIISLKEDTPETEKLKIREEFPFLNDDNCPDVMHVAVGKKIAAYYREIEINAKIHALKESNPEDEALEQLAKDAIEAYQENESLYQELVHYRDNGVCLGKHPLFDELLIKQEVEIMSNDESLKFVNSSKTYFSRKSKELEKATADKKESIERDVKLREYKLKLVKNKLGV